MTIDPKPRVDRRTVHRDDVLNIVIGEYVVQFANMDFHLGLIASSLLKINIAVVTFIFKDIFTDQKIKIVRRAAQALEKSISESIVTTLNKATKRSEFRNSLLHGHFIREDGPGSQTIHGKAGANVENIFQGFKPIEFDIQNEVQEIGVVIRELGEHLSLLHKS